MLMNGLSPLAAPPKAIARGVAGGHEVDGAHRLDLRLLEAGAELLRGVADGARAVAARPGVVGVVEFVEGAEPDCFGGGHVWKPTSALHDLTCVAHLHSTHSDGTGTIPEIARAASHAGVDVVLLTDHDNLAGLAEEGWYGDVLVLVGEEISPPGQDHYLAFGTTEHTRRRDRSPGRDLPSGGRRRRLRLRRAPVQPRQPGSSPAWRRACPFNDLDCVDGIELWSMVTDTAEGLRSWADALRFVARPEDVDRPPAARQPRRMGPAERHAQGGGPGRARRPPDRQAHRGPRAATADELPPLVPPAPHARAHARTARRAMSTTTSSRCTTRCARAAPTSPSTGWPPPAASASSRRRRAPCPHPAPGPPAPDQGRRADPGRLRRWTCASTRTSTGRLPRRGVPPRARARAHLDPVQPASTSHERPLRALRAGLRRARRPLRVRGPRRDVGERARDARPQSRQAHPRGLEVRAREGPAPAHPRP